MLTAKQEKFCRAIAIDHMNYTEAYKYAYDTSRTTDKSCYEKASRMVKEVKIKSRIEELRNEIDSPRIMSAIKRKEKLTDIIMNSPDENAQMKAIDILNKMSGEYIQRIEAEVDNNVNINIALVDDDEC